MVSDRCFSHSLQNVPKCLTLILNKYFCDYCAQLQIVLGLLLQTWDHFKNGLLGRLVFARHTEGLGFIATLVQIGMPVSANHNNYVIFTR